MNSNEPKDVATSRERAVAEGAELRERAVDHARKVGDALGLAEPPVSADAPPAYAAPPVPAPPYPHRTMKETLPATPRAIARRVAGSQPPTGSPAAAEATPAAGAPAAIPPTVSAVPVTVVAVVAPPDPPSST